MKTIDIRGHRLSYLDLNPEREQAVLLVHGHPFNHSMWADQYEALDGFRIVNPDLFGYGQSHAAFDKIYIEHQALDLALLLDQLHLEQVHLIGLSMGGQIIVEFSRLFPHRVRSLVICASTPQAETEASYQARLRKAAEIEQSGMHVHTQQTIDQYINVAQHQPGSRVYEHLFQMMSTTPVSGAVASHRGRAERRDNVAYLKQLSLPALVIAGEKDFFFPWTEVQKVADSIANARFVVMENVGHLPNMEDPQVFNEHLSAFYAAQGGLA